MSIALLASLGITGLKGHSSAAHSVHAVESATCYSMCTNLPLQKSDRLDDLAPDPDEDGPSNVIWQRVSVAEIAQIHNDQAISANNLKSHPPPPNYILNSVFRV